MTTARKSQQDAVACKQGTAKSGEPMKTAEIRDMVPSIRFLRPPTYSSDDELSSGGSTSASPSARGRTNDEVS